MIAVAVAWEYLREYLRGVERSLEEQRRERVARGPVQPQGRPPRYLTNRWMGYGRWHWERGLRPAEDPEQPQEASSIPPEF